MFVEAESSDAEDHDRGEKERGWKSDERGQVEKETGRLSRNRVEKSRRGEPERELLEILALYEWEPGIREVQEAAIRYAFTNRATVASWKKRVRSAAWLPDFRVKFDQTRGAEYRLKGVPGTSSEWAEKEGDGLSYGIQMTWSLGKLVFNADELKVHREAQRIAEMREEIMHGVTRIFFERRRLQINQHLNPPRTVRAAVSRRLAIERLEGLLDGVTGGWHGKELKKRRPPANVKSGPTYRSP